MHFRKSGLVGLAALAASIGAASATTLQDMNLQDLVSASAVIVEGTVESASTQNTGSGIFTTTRVRVNDPVVGSPGGVVSVVTPGGHAKSGRFAIAEQSAGAPRFMKDQRVLLFLQADNAGGYSVVGFSQGAMEVKASPAGQATVLSRATGGSTPLGQLKTKIRELKASK